MHTRLGGGSAGRRLPEALSHHDFKNKALVKFIDENSYLKNAIMEREIELQRQCDLIRALREKLGDDGDGDGQQ